MARSSFIVRQAVLDLVASDFSYKPTAAIGVGPTGDRLRYERGQARILRCCEGIFGNIRAWANSTLAPFLHSFLHGTQFLTVYHI